MNWIDPGEALLFLAVGAALGAGYFLLLYWTVRKVAARGAGVALVLLYIARLAGAVAAFWFIAQHGALPLLLALLGFMLARIAIQRRVEPQ